MTELNITFDTLLETVGSKNLVCSGCGTPQPVTERQVPEVEIGPEGQRTVWIKAYLCSACRSLVEERRIR